MTLTLAFLLVVGMATVGCSSILADDDMHIIRIKHLDKDLHPELLEKFAADCEVLGHSRLSNTEVGCRSLRHVRSVEAALNAHGHSYAVTNEDARLRETHHLEVDARSCHGGHEEPAVFNHSRYHSTDEIESFVRHLANKYKTYVDLTVAEEKSRLGRNLTILTIRDQSRIRRNSVWIDAGLHAREWISPAATLYFIEKLLKEFDQNLHNSTYTKVSWTIMPLVNPDGYEHSRSDASERYWRKNRSPPPQSHKRCHGTDLNRNVADCCGMKAYGIGASSNPCSDVYKGTEGNSEPETRAVINEVNRLYHSKHTNLTSSIAVHSYGQKWLTSWGYKFEEPVDIDRLTRWGKRAAEAIKTVRGTVYGVATASEGLYAAGGATDDYAKALGVDFVATLELGDTGDYGFALPASEIEDTGEEMYAAMGVVAETAANPDKYS